MMLRIHKDKLIDTTDMPDYWRARNPFRNPARRAQFEGMMLDYAKRNSVLFHVSGGREPVQQHR